MHLFLFLLVVTLGLSCEQATPTPAPPPSAAFQWPFAQENNRDSAQLFIDSLLLQTEQGQYGHIDALLIIQDDSILWERQFSNDYAQISQGKTGKMGCGSGSCSDSNAIHLYNYYHPKYHPYYLDSDLHSLQSVTKSIASTLIALAIQEGKLSLQDPLYPYFKDDTTLSQAMQAQLKEATLEDVLTMRLGLNWLEMGTTLEMENNVTAMEQSADWVAYTLQQTIDTVPGAVWNYNSGASQLLAFILEQATQQTLEDYAEQHLFGPLGINHYYWKKTPTGLADTEGGLYLKARDLAKIGRLYLQKGQWQGQQILSKAWIEKAWSKHSIDLAQDGSTDGYGYQWWISQEEKHGVFALGYGNQVLVVIPQKNIIAVVLAWNVFEEEHEVIFRDLGLVFDYL
ncbi:MAG: serine hydrolase domain-containing protein [Aureispira sp.]